MHSFLLGLIKKIYLTLYSGEKKEQEAFIPKVAFIYLSSAPPIVINLNRLTVYFSELNSALRQFTFSKDY